MDNFRETVQSIEPTLDLYEALESFFQQKQKSINTAIPCHVLAFNPKTQLAQVQVGVKRVYLDGKTQAIAPIIDVPVLVYGGNSSLEFKVQNGDEGLLVFSQRCIDGWLNTGGVAENPLSRFHSLTDAFVILGFRPNPRALKNYDNDGIKLRNLDNSQRIHLKDDKSILITNGSATVELKPNGDIIANGNNISATAKSNLNLIIGSSSIKMNSSSINIVAPTVVINGLTVPAGGSGGGTASYSGTIKTTNDVIAGTVKLKSHTHNGVEPGGGNTGAPN